MIRISPVRLISADGDQRGIVSLEQAREEASDVGLDLVEVAATSRPPVVRIMDWGRYQYEQQKRAKEAKKKQHTVSLKEVKLRPRTDDHDLGFKLRNARRFLEKGSNVKVTVRFRGPELRRPDLGQDLLDLDPEERAAAGDGSGDGDAGDGGVGLEAPLQLRDAIRQAIPLASKLGVRILCENVGNGSEPRVDIAVDPVEAYRAYLAGVEAEYNYRLADAHRRGG